MKLQKMTKKELANTYNGIIEANGIDGVLTVNVKGQDHIFKAVKTFSSVAIGEKRLIFLIKITNTRSQKVVDICWEIFESLENPVRKDAINTCVEAGINKSTAATQWQKYRSSRGITTTSTCAKIRSFVVENIELPKKEIIQNLVDLGFNAATVKTQVYKVAAQ